MQNEIQVQSPYLLHCGGVNAHFSRAMDNLGQIVKSGDTGALGWIGSQLTEYSSIFQSYVWHL